MDTANLGQWMQTVSKIGDPGLLFVLYLPLVLGIHFKSGVKFLGAAVVCEWSNMILKW